MKQETTHETENSTALSVVITTDWAKELPAQIHWNYDELKASLEKTLEPLKNMVLEKNDDNVKFAKTKRAEINKLGKMLLEARVGTKKRVLAPYLDFEDKANALIAMCDEASNGFDEFVKEAEAEANGRKWEEIKKYLFERINEEMSEDGLHSRALEHFKEFCHGNVKWLNATYKMTEIHAEIDAEISKCLEAYRNVVEMYTVEYDGHYLDIAKEEIVKDFDVGRVTLCVSKKHREHERILAEEKAKIELEARRKAQEEAAKEDERRRLEVEEMARKAKEAAEKEAAERKASESPQTGDETQSERSGDGQDGFVRVGVDEWNEIQKILNRNVNRFGDYESMTSAWSSEYEGVAMKDWMFAQRKECK